MENDIVLSIQERLIIANQLELKALLDPKADREHLSEVIEALKGGYSIHYAEAFEEFSNEEMSIEECKFVLDVLTMYSGIIFSYELLKETGKIEKLSDTDIQFEGFDGNQESKYMYYTRYFLKTLDRFEEIQKNNTSDNYNSHMPRVDKYKAMLPVFNELVKKYGSYCLTEEEIITLLEMR